jgi:hypothetical protein
VVNASVHPIKSKMSKEVRMNSLAVASGQKTNVFYVRLLRFLLGVASSRQLGGGILHLALEVSSTCLVTICRSDRNWLWVSLCTVFTCFV